MRREVEAMAVRGESGSNGSWAGREARDADRERRTCERTRRCWWRKRRARLCRALHLVARTALLVERKGARWCKRRCWLRERHC